METNTVEITREQAEAIRFLKSNGNKWSDGEILE